MKRAGRVETSGNVPGVDFQVAGQLGMFFERRGRRVRVRHARHLFLHAQPVRRGGLDGRKRRQTLVSKYEQQTRRLPGAVPEGRGLFVFRSPKDVCSGCTGSR